MTKSNINEFEEAAGGHGKKANQKLKPYLVLQYLLKYSDENNVVTAPEIVSYLQDDCGIYAERRSVYKDINEINKAMLTIENECNIIETEEMLEGDTYDEEKFIVYDKSQKGFYAQPRGKSRFARGRFVNLPYNIFLKLVLDTSFWGFAP